MNRRFIFALFAIFIALSGVVQAQEYDIKKSRLGHRLGFIKLRDCQLFAGVAHTLVMPTVRFNTASEFKQNIGLIRGAQLRVVTNDGTERFGYRLGRKEQYRYFQCHRVGDVITIVGRNRLSDAQQEILVTSLNFPVRPITSEIAARRTTSSTSSTNNSSCCKICSKGKACGDSCIASTYECYQPKGCACDGDSSSSRTSSVIETIITPSSGSSSSTGNSSSGSGGCCKICKSGQACGDSCISRSYQCRKGSGCACNG